MFRKFFLFFITCVYLPLVSANSNITNNEFSLDEFHKSYKKFEEDQGIVFDYQIGKIQDNRKKQIMSEFSKAFQKRINSSEGLDFITKNTKDEAFNININGQLVEAKISYLNKKLSGAIHDAYFFKLKIDNHDLWKFLIRVQKETTSKEELKFMFLETYLQYAVSNRANPLSLPVYGVFYKEIHGKVIDISDVKLGEEVLKSAFLNPEISGKTKIKYILQLAKDLRDFHKYGFAFMDLHPFNFILDKDLDKLVLIDFGLSESLKSYPELGEHSTYKGLKPPEAELIPELRKSAHYDLRKYDTYAFGIILISFLMKGVDFNNQTEYFKTLKEQLRQPCHIPSKLLSILEMKNNVDSSKLLYCMEHGLLETKPWISPLIDGKIKDLAHRMISRDWKDRIDSDLIVRELGDIYKLSQNKIE